MMASGVRGRSMGMIRLALARRGCSFVLLGIGLLAALDGPAAAQSASQALTVDQIRACMCEEQTIGRLRQDLATSQAAYDDRNAQIQRLSQKIQMLQATMDPNDTSAQDQLGELIDLRARVEQQLYEQELPRLQKSTRALNGEVADYNGKCVGRPIYETDQAAANKDFSCPKP
jgi:hypothetical protein